MKFSFITLLFFSTFIQTEKKSYQNPEGDYRMDIPKSAEVKRTESNANMLLDEFVFRQPGEQVKSYVITVGIAKNVGTGNETKLSNDFIDGYLKTCNCEVLERKKVNFKHFSGLQLKTKIQQSSGKTFLQYNEQFIKNRVSYMITFISLEANFPKYEPSFLEIIDTFVPLK